jgi:hypothetical protein
MTCTNVLTTVVLCIAAAAPQAVETVVEEPMYYDNTNTTTETVYDDTTAVNVDADTTTSTTANTNEGTANNDADDNDDDVREVNAPSEDIQMRYGKPVPGPRVITRTAKPATNNKLRITKTSNKITLPWPYTVTAAEPSHAELKKLHLQRAHVLVMFYDKDLRKLVWDEYLVKQVRT